MFLSKVVRFDAFCLLFVCWHDLFFTTEGGQTMIEFINENNSNNTISKTNNDIKELRKTEFNATYEEHA